MVDVVSAVSVQSSALRLGSQGASVAASAEPAQNASADVDFVSSAIRVDNLQNVAILEYRSSRTGEVVQRYPTQAQIDAFKRAEPRSAPAPQSTPPLQTGGGETQAVNTAPPAAAASPATPAPAPATPSGDTATSVLV